MDLEKANSDWVVLSTAAALIDVSRDTILRRAVPWQAQHVPQRIRFKILVLDRKTRQTRRYFRPDVEALLSSTALPQ